MSYRTENADSLLHYHLTWSQSQRAETERLRPLHTNFKVRDTLTLSMGSKEIPYSFDMQIATATPHRTGHRTPPATATRHRTPTRHPPPNATPHRYATQNGQKRQLYPLLLTHTPPLHQGKQLSADCLGLTLNHHPLHHRHPLHLLLQNHHHQTQRSRHRTQRSHRPAPCRSRRCQRPR